MTDTATELTPAEQAPHQEPVAQPQGDGDPAPLNITDDAAVDAALQTGAIEVPGQGKLVDGETAGKIAASYRGQIRELKKELDTAKTSASRAGELEQQIAALSAKVTELQPYVTAYQQMTQAAQQAAEPSQDDAEAEEYAKLLDLYTPEGKPDIARGKRGIAIQRRLAEQVAQQHVAPIQQQSVSERSAGNFARAANTAIGQVKADPAILKMVWSRLDPSVTATPEGAQHALIQAIGMTVLQQNLGGQQPQAGAQRAPNGQFVKQEPVSDPIFTEKAGGKDSPASDLPLNDKEQAFLKQTGMSEKEYRESAKSAPWLRR